MSDTEPISEDPAPLATTEPTAFRVMNVESVLYDLTDTSPLIHLTEAEVPYRYMAVPVALPEAIALHNALSRIDGLRPSSHELFTDVLSRVQCDVIAARIVRYDHGVFYAELDLMTQKGREVFDCRTSDALIMALRQSVPAPVLCSEAVLEQVYGSLA